jgi:hypothetical protein
MPHSVIVDIVMNHVNLEESIGVSDFHRVELELDSIIHRNEFEKFRSEYLRSNEEKDLIFTFIVLQIYMECFLHQNMRKIVEMEFLPPRQAVREEWLSEPMERRDARDKIDYFVKLFDLGSLVSTPVSGIKERFTNLTDIRNLLAHGHKIAKWSDSLGNSGTTKARSLLTRDQLTQIEKRVNELGLLWNELLDKIQPQCKVLRRIDDFKFQNI